MVASSSSEDDRQQSIFRRAASTILTPLDIATSRPAIKAYLSTLLFLTASLILIAISTTAYLIFYYNYVPQIGLEELIHLQYGDGPHPHATAALETTALMSQQPYDINLELYVPRTPNNLAAGNFMLELSLLSRPSTSSSMLGLSGVIPNASTTLAHSRRSAILSYHSPMLSLANNVVALPWHTFGFKDLDAEILSTPMFEHVSFARGWRNIPGAVKLELQSDTTLQVYSAKVLFTARFEGLRYILYNYRILSFLLFTSCFYTVSLTSTSVAWFIISTLLASDNPKTKHKPDSTQKEIKQDETEGQTSNGHIKKEPQPVSDHSSDESGLSLSNLSDSATTFPTLGRQMPLRFPVPVHRKSDSVVSAASSKSIKRESDEEKVLEGAAIEPLAADDEDDEDEASRGRDRADRDRDSGIGTSMESEGARDTRGLQRRRSGKLPGASEGASHRE